jgi:hypothetical protein
MEIKGTAVKSIIEYVKAKHEVRFGEWIKSLPNQSKDILMGMVTSNGWYPLEEAGSIPTQKIGELFFEGDAMKGAWESGRFSADDALNGIYKLYVKFSSPGHIIARASRVFSAYYRPSVMETFDQKPNSVKLRITRMDEPSAVIENRIAGWVERALEISGCNEVEINLPSSISKGDSSTIIECNWK